MANKPNKKVTIKVKEEQIVEQVTSNEPEIASISKEKAMDEIVAIATAKKLKKDTVTIKIPIDPLNEKDLVVPVKINGYKWIIKRGETVEVPRQVAKILEDARYI